MTPSTEPYTRTGSVGKDPICYDSIHHLLEIIDANGNANSSFTRQKLCRTRAGPVRARLKSPH